MLLLYECEVDHLAAIGHQILTGEMCRQKKRNILLCWCTCNGKIRAEMITTCRHSDIPLDTLQWAVGHSPAEKSEPQFEGQKQGFGTSVFGKGKAKHSKFELLFSSGRPIVDLIIIHNNTHQANDTVYLSAVDITNMSTLRLHNNLHKTKHYSLTSSVRLIWSNSSN